MQFYRNCTNWYRNFAVLLIDKITLSCFWKPTKLFIWLGGVVSAAVIFRDSFFQYTLLFYSSYFNWHISSGLFSDGCVQSWLELSNAYLRALFAFLTLRSLLREWWLQPKFFVSGGNIKRERTESLWSLFYRHTIPFLTSEVSWVALRTSFVTLIRWILSLLRVLLLEHSLWFWFYAWMGSSTAFIDSYNGVRWFKSVEIRQKVVSLICIESS